MAASSFLLIALLAFCQVTLVTCAVESDWINRTLSQHFSQPRHHVSNPRYKAEAMQFIAQQFRASGLETHLHNFTTDLSNVTGVTVVGVLRGRFFNTSQDRVTGIGAHYDTMRDTPGVNDNGAAVVVMLAAIRELTQQKGQRNFTLIFIAFDFEEWESSNEPLVACSTVLCGSRSLVRDWVPSFFQTPLGWGGIYVLDTIMNFDLNASSQNFPLGIDQVFPDQMESILSDRGRGDFMMLAGRDEDTELLQAFNMSWVSQGQPQFEMEVFPLAGLAVNIPAFQRSDHAAFWEQGLSAAFLSDTANYRGYMASCYHQECDAMQRVTPAMIDFAAKTCRSLIGSINKMAPIEAGDTSGSGGQWSNTAMLAGVVASTMLLGHHGYQL